MFSPSSSKPNQDLLNLDFFNSSSASTPTGANYTLPSPLSPQTEINWGLTSAPSAAAAPPPTSPGSELHLYFYTNAMPDLPQNCPSWSFVASLFLQAVHNAC